MPDTTNPASPAKVNRARIPSNEERAQAMRLTERAANRDRFFDLLRTAIACLFWCAAGVLLLSLSVHTNNEGTGWIFFWSGLVVGNAGILATLFRFFLRAQRRGDV